MQVGGEVRVGIAGSAAFFEVIEAVVAPQMHHLVERADAAGVEGQRRAEMPEQHRHGQAVEHLEELGHAARLDGVDAVIDDRLVEHQMASFWRVAGCSGCAGAIWARWRPVR
ncbi:hypothetical protein D3C75_1040760 [compost metagenome]